MPCSNCGQCRNSCSSEFYPYTSPTVAGNQYETYLGHVFENGTYKADRTGIGTFSVFGYQMRFNLAQGFPLVTTKKVHFKSVALELLWFLAGRRNVKWLQERGCTIWDEWARADGDLGPIYGVQWRTWPKGDGSTVDQISQAVSLLKNDPDSRRIIVSAWNVSELDQMALMPCHVLFQFNTRTVAGSPKRYLDCQLYQRSSDSLLGGPFNIASYSLLVHMMAQQCDMLPGDFIWTVGDAHLYTNHVEQAKLQLSRTPYPYPKLRIKRRPASLFDYDLDDFEVVDYVHHPAIKAAVAV